MEPSSSLPPTPIVGAPTSASKSLIENPHGAAASSNFDEDMRVPPRPTFEILDNRSATPSPVDRTFQGLNITAGLYNSYKSVNMRAYMFFFSLSLFLLSFFLPRFIPRCRCAKQNMFNHSLACVVSAFVASVAACSKM